MCPCFVSSEIFLRDISFHLIAVITISLVAVSKDIYVTTSLIMFSIYLVYVMTIIILSKIAQRRADEAAKAGVAAKKNIRKIRDDNTHNTPVRTFGNAVQQAYWYKNDNPKFGTEKASESIPSAKQASSDISKQSIPGEIRGVGKTGYTFLILDEADEDEAGNSNEGRKHKKGNSSSDDGSNSSSDDDDDLINLSGGLVGGCFTGEIFEVMCLFLLLRRRIGQVATSLWSDKF